MKNSKNNSTKVIEFVNFKKITTNSFKKYNYFRVIQIVKKFVDV